MGPLGPNLWHRAPGSGPVGRGPVSYIPVRQRRCRSPLLVPRGREAVGGEAPCQSIPKTGIPNEHMHALACLGPVHIYIYIHTDIQIYVYIYTDIHIYRYTCTCTCTRTQTKKKGTLGPLGRCSCRGAAPWPPCRNCTPIGVACAETPGDSHPPVQVSICDFCM